MSIFESEQRDRIVSEQLRALVTDDLAETGPSAHAVLAAGMLVILRKLDEQSAS